MPPTRKRLIAYFFSSRRRHTRLTCDWSSDVCSSDLSRRVVIFGVEANPRYPHAEPVPTTVLINPVLEQIGGEMEEGWEGCLSVPGLRGLVSRYKNLRYTGFDQRGRPIDRTVSGFHARVAQHECDHLDGILYPMRLKDIRLLGFEEALFREL